jgi:uncharacterized protein (DUF1499 family)
MALTIIKWLALTFLALTLLAVLAGQFGFLRGVAPADLGVRDGRLKPPSSTPNSVTSQAALWPGHPQQAYASIAPLALRGDGPATLARIAELLRAQPGVVVVTSRPDYLHAEATTRVMKYTDDIECWLDPAAGVVHVRSASRLGRGDFGANRARVEALRAALAG